MKELNKELLNGDFQFPDDLKASPLTDMPEKVLQFGEGNFLRGFVDWMIHKLNMSGQFGGKVVVVQPIEKGLAEMLNNQDGLYTLYLRGIQNGKTVEEKEIISSISRAIDPYCDYEEYLKCAENAELRVIISNTTEAGIAYIPEDKLNDTPPSSFPAKLTAFLYHRFETFCKEGNVSTFSENKDSDKGLIIIPCELIDRNGDNLKKVVLKYASEWKLGEAFINWINNSNYFLNTLVDRIVTGYPRDEIEALTNELGYKDNLINTAEIFHLWVIEGDKKLSEELPFHKIGLDVIWTDDMTPYRTRKVRILNGAHTMTVLAAYLFGLDTVKECIDDKTIYNYMKKGIFEEIIPTLDLPEKELNDFANAVLERFANPFIKHYLLSISLNSTSKFKTRVLPSILEYIKRKGELPAILTFSMSALIAFYRGTQIKGTYLEGTRAGKAYEIHDDMSALELFRSLWSACDDSFESVRNLVEVVLGREDMWGANLNEVSGLANKISEYLYEITTNGINNAIMKVL